MARLQHIANSIAQKILDAYPGIKVYNDRAPDNLPYEQFPIVIYRITLIAPVHYMGSARDIFARLHVGIYIDKDKGTAALRDIEQKIFDALDRQKHDVEDWSNVQTFGMARGDSTFVPNYRLMASIDEYQIIGSEI